MKYLSILSVVLMTLLVACSSNPEEQTKKVNEDDLFSRLSADLISNPRTQREKDQNAIVNYALDSTLNVRSTPSGIYYQIVKEGEGEHPTKKNALTAHYTGRLLNGKVFDSSKKAGRPLQFKLNRMINGWKIAIPMLKPGGKGIFLIPSHLAYKEIGFGQLIPPNSPLLFEIELISSK